MTMADVFTVVFILLGFFMALPSVWLLFGALWPNAVGRAQERCHRAPLKSFFLGVATAGAFTLATIILSVLNVPFLAGLVAAFGIGFSLLGVSGLARHVGTRLPSSIDSSSPWRVHLRGSIVLELAFLFPMLGWLLIFPLALILGSGAATMAVFSRRPVTVPQPAREPIEVMA